MFHDAPNIPHFGRAGEGMALRQGMFFTIEPMINAGRWEVKILADGWTAVTKDRSLSAQFEHSIGVTADGYEVYPLARRLRAAPRTPPDPGSAHGGPVTPRQRTQAYAIRKLTSSRARVETPTSRTDLRRIAPACRRQGLEYSRPE